MKTRRDDQPSYVTRDGSLIRELMHPAQHPVRRQSLAEATVPAGGRTLLHLHRATEELYHVVAGAGIMTLGSESFPVGPGDTVLIPPGTPHCVAAGTDGALVILCACSPAYSHEDTEMLEEDRGE